MTRIIPHYIGGKAIIEQAQPLWITNPANGQNIALLYCGDEQIVDKAIQHAVSSQAGWAATPAIKRAKILRAFASLLEEKEDELAEIVTLEHGKTIADAKASIQRGIEVVAYHCDIQHQLQGTYSHHVSHQVDTTTFYQPLGICAGISPFNFPVMVPLWMMIPAIACGNAFILKPSEKTPSASLKLIEWLEESGLPAGIAQCIQGDAQTVQYLLNRSEIQAFTAVGSTRAAQHIYTEACKFGKRAATFGGAKNHAIVMPDANLAHAADSIISAAYGSAGQRCMALAAVIAVGELTAEHLIPLLIERIQSINVGPGHIPGVDLGPVISQAQLAFLKDAIQQGVDEGATLLTDGRLLNLAQYEDGFFIGPSLFDNVTPNMSIYQKELFGPVLSILRMNSLEEAMACMNQHPYGNGAVIFTQHGYDAQQFIDKAQAGMIGINIPIPVPIVSHPFGGWKQSSFGSSPMHGLGSIYFYTRQKSVTTAWPQEQGHANFDMPHH